MKTDLIRVVTFGESGLTRVVTFGGSGLIRGATFGGSGLIRGATFGGSGLIRRLVTLEGVNIVLNHYLKFYLIRGWPLVGVAL